ncbi:hypothetical protein [Flavobacterium caseinilyticum]|uniref:Uncharacterized protein n=1 Tax=Flavobacterium caseinilyticum TaxID=2541732 RepID=A0A4V2YUB6_9FLAO|nr:hypothetical protein [Flavobacterium caseinilyticum]TDD77087.1 hypothetical protein E0F89_05675 [Flavobacterium caseinilyticum]
MEVEKIDHLELWHKVEKTNPKYTKSANVKGNQITSIGPQFQIMNVTEQFGSYGATWGFKNIELDYSLVATAFKREKSEGVYPNKKIVGTEDAYMGLVVFKADFFYPGGEFPIINSISLFTNNDMTKLDDNFAKKLETDTLTKAISKLGFNADIFLGKFDDTRYVEEMKNEFNPPAAPVPPAPKPPKPPKVIDATSLKAILLSDLKGLNATIDGITNKKVIATAEQILQIQNKIVELTPAPETPAEPEPEKVMTSEGPESPWITPDQVNTALESTVKQLKSTINVIKKGKLKARAGDLKLLEDKLAKLEKVV